MTPTLMWFKSSYSGNDGPDCVEVAISLTNATIHIRDSKDRDAAWLAFSDTSWVEFVTFAASR
ncbi:MAG: DUF397 domain-containing protein [Streptomyces sp.]|nr:DUF397 domain-containing protein [Streptomyces sp.]NUT25365.1 DUF397 domain-containing protein [Streptomyces sp.]